MMLCLLYGRISNGSSFQFGGIVGESRMKRKIKVRCNGANKHVNEVDLDDALREDSIARHADFSSSSVLSESSCGVVNAPTAR
jgi:hypothetical protein